MKRISRHKQAATVSMTVPTDINQKVVGYVINTSLSIKGQKAVAGLQKRLSLQFPDAFWAVPPEALHITLLDLLTPVTTYSEDTDLLYRRLKDDYLQAITTILKAQLPISVSFDTLQLFPTALIIKGHDNGSFGHIREQFMNKVTLLPNTKLPPSIIHSTIGKFTKAVPLSSVASALANERVAFEELIRNFCLVRETKVFMLEHQVLGTFQLEAKGTTLKVQAQKCEKA